jgi:hypothetical protein
VGSGTFSTGIGVPTETRNFNEYCIFFHDSSPKANVFEMGGCRLYMIHLCTVLRNCCIKY